MRARVSRRTIELIVRAGSADHAEGDAEQADQVDRDVDVLGQVLHQVAAPGQITLPGTLDGGELEAEDVDVSIDLIRLLRVALRVVR